MNEKDDKLNKGSFLYIGDQDKAEWGYPEGYPSKSVQTITLMEEQELAFAAAGSLYFASLPSMLDIVGGQTYTVKWDGTEHKCVCSIFNGKVLAIGNLSIIGMGSDTGEPFCYISAEGGFTTLDTAASHTISVKTIEETVYPMASAFLPQATQTTHGTVKQMSYLPNATGAAPTSNDFNKLLSALREAGIMSQAQ